MGANIGRATTVIVVTLLLWWEERFYQTTIMVYITLINRNARIDFPSPAIDSSIQVMQFLEAMLF